MSEVINIKELNERIERESVFVDTLRSEMGKVIIGQNHLIDTLLIGLLSNGHILLEGVPGLAKTLAITTLAKAVDADFSRIQFTPDLLPADITGSVPNIRAVSTSRTMPSTRLSMVKPPTANANRMTLRFSMRLKSPRPGTSWPPGTALESDSGHIPACARSSSAARGTPLHATSWSTPQMARFFATHIQF